MKAAITKELLESADVKRLLAEDGVEVILEIARALIEVLLNKGKIVFCGNGGSAADAQHLATELVGMYLMERAPIPAMAFTTNTSLLTALGNDYGFETIFTRQIKALLCKEDALVTLSTSGDSPNVIAAVKAAQEKGALTIGLTGQLGGELSRVANLSLLVPSQSVPRIQEAHITVGHILCSLLESQVAKG